jgi:hypothetical protein
MASAWRYENDRVSIAEKAAKAAAAAKENGVKYQWLAYMAKAYGINGGNQWRKRRLASWKKSRDNWRKEKHQRWHEKISGSRQHRHQQLAK